MTPAGAAFGERDEDGQEDAVFERDNALRDRIRAGDRSAFDTLYLIYAQPLYDRAYSILRSQSEAEEIVQELFFSMWQRHADWSGEGSVAHYLLRAIRNSALDYLRHRRVMQQMEARAQRDDRHLFLISTPSESVEEYVVADDLKERIQHAIDALPERRRTALMLRMAHHLSFADIGEVMQISEKAAHLLVTRARESLTPLLRHFKS